MGDSLGVWFLVVNGNWRDDGFPLRQFDPLRGRSAEQEMAEYECGRLAPLILECKRIITEETEGL